MKAPLELSSAVDLPLQEASRNIWDTKYRLKSRSGDPIDQDIYGTCQRVARALADVEQGPRRDYWYERFVWALQRGAIPAGRIISNAGAGAHKPATSTINCTVSHTVGDSMHEILEKVHEAGMTLKAGCGIGYEFSTLRPRGAYVSGAGAHTSGPLSFMDIYDKMCFTVSSAGGRRGAQMGTFDVGHPDAMEFIRAKRENGRLRQFNLSLLISDEFMDAVKNDQPWPLAFPLAQREAREDRIDLEDPAQVVWRKWPTRDGYICNRDGLVACRVYKTIPARRMWDIIMSSTYDFAEPGFVLIDRVNELNNNWWCEDIRATNPCVTRHTWIHTSEGPRQVADLIGRPFEAMVNGEAYPTDSRGFFPTGKRQVFELESNEGYRLTLTPNHRVRRVAYSSRWTMKTEWVEAANLVAGDKIILHDHRGAPAWNGPRTEGEGYLIGLLVGDGTLKEDEAVLSAWPGAMTVNGDFERPGALSQMRAAELAARELPHRADFRGWHAIPGRGEYRMKPRAIKRLADTLGLRPGHKTVTDTMHRASSDFQIGFLRGLFDCDASVQGHQVKGISIRLAQSNEDLLVEVQRMLLRLGIVSQLYVNRRDAGYRRLPDGRGGFREYFTKAQHELVISRNNIEIFQSRIGFADREKSLKLATALANYSRRVNRERFTATLKSINPVSEHDVFDVSVPGANAFDANGLMVHNCGEQPLPSYGACLLGSVNLTKFVVDPFSAQARFDWDEYREVVRVFTRMLDNVVEINGLPLEAQRREIHRKRRHGMGFLGLGSTLALLGIRYGSPESVKFTEKVARELAIAGWQVALELAREKGPAPILVEEFDVTEEMLSMRPMMRSDGWKVGDRIPGRILHARYSHYMRNLAEVAPELVEDLAEEGARFTHHSSIAPTGTISLSLGNNASNGIEPSFAHRYFRNVIMEGKKTKEKVEVFSFELLAYRELVNRNASPSSDNSADRVPDYFVSSEDISPKEHVDIQAAAQKWIDSSISKTANVPTDYPYGDFKDIYRYAHEKGLKGCTTFRFNPEAFQGVLVKEKDLKNTTYRFELANGNSIEARGDDEIEYDGEVHTAANLFDALKEGYYGKL